MPPVAQFTLPNPNQQPQAQPSQGQSGMPPVAQFSLPQSSNTTNPATSNIGINTIKGVGNFLFPAVGDAYNDLTGKNTKTPLQQAGDVALTALPFIPGLGEAGEGARVAEAGVEGAADVAKSGGLLSKVLANPITKGAGIGYGAGVAANLSQGKNLGQAVTPNPTNLISAATGGAMSALTPLLGRLGDKISFGVIKPNAADIKDGFSIDTIKNNNLGGSLGTTLTKTRALMSDLSSQLKQKLQGSTNTIDLASVFDKTAKDLTSNEGTLSNFGSNSGISRSLAKLQDEVLKANPTGSLSIPDAQTVKQAAGGMGAWQFGSADPDATSIETVYNKFYHNLKTEIENKSPEGVKDINSKMSDLIPVLNAVIRRIPIAERNAGLSLPDMIGLVGSAMNPLAALPTAAEMALKSGTVGSLLSKAAPYAQKLSPAASTITARTTSGLLGK